MQIIKSPLEHFTTLIDYRDKRYVTHSLIKIIAISLSAIICGAKDWYEVADFGNCKLHWFKTFLDIGDKTPSHDTLKRFFSSIDPNSLEKSFSSWIASIANITEGRIISIDGKTLRGSKASNDTHFVHMVSAWCNSNGLVLAQQKVNEKSNEITAIPALLDLLIVKGCTITIDAMGCQQNIAAKIIDKEADYILAVKDNQKFLHQDIKEAFENEKNIETYSSSNVGHGRIETRTTKVISNLEWICKSENWKSLYCIIQVISTRENKQTNIIETAARYYISSKKETAQFYQNAIRWHWSIENQLHWVLDVVFGEDGSKKQDKNSAQNFSLLNKIVLNMLRNYEIPNYKSTHKMSIKRKQKIASWENEIILDILFKDK